MIQEAAYLHSLYQVLSRYCCRLIGLAQNAEHSLILVMEFVEGILLIRNLHMPEDSHVVLTEQEYLFSAPAFNGGKTDVRVMHRTWTEEQIYQGKYGSYVDVQSMYPYVQYTKPMPCGIPTFKNFEQNDAIDIKFLKTFIGIIECDIQPTRYLHHPVIGCFENGKYVFDLKPKTKITITSAELQKALEYDYKVTRLYGALVFPKAEILFKSYVQTFLKIKLEASGMPSADWEEFARRHRDELGIE